MALHNLARMTTATSGTGTITLGSAVSGFLTFALAGVIDGEIVTYSIRDGANSEIGAGTYTAAGTTLARTTIYNSTNSNNAISLSGSAEVFITAASQDIRSYHGITPMYPVPSTGWSWDNQKTATITSSGGVEGMAAVTSGSEWQLRYRTPVNANWTITTLITSLAISTTSSAFGIGFRDSGGKLIMLTMYFNNAQFVAYRWNSSTSFSGAAVSSVGIGAIAPIWMRLQYDGTNVIFTYSLEGQIWHTLHSETRATFLAAGTPDFCWGGDGIGGALKVSLLSYVEV